MKWRLIILVAFVLGVFVKAQAQDVLVYDTRSLFRTSESILTDVNDKPYFVMTNAHTAISQEVNLHGGRNGDVRVSVTGHATTGTLSMDVYIGMKIADFGSDDLDYKWILLGSLSNTDDGVTKTYLLTNFPEWVAPIIAYKVKAVTIDGEVVEVKINVLQWKL